MQEGLNLDTRQSTLIKAMRFPLIVLVVFAHSLGFGNVEITNDLSGWNVYHFFSEMLSHNLARLAVCWFYVFSGYFFFRNLKEGEFTFKWVTGKWTKRVRSLLVPYLIWNALAVLAIVVKSFVFSAFGLGEDPGMEWVRQFDVLNWFVTGPADFPLYFMRDLMIMSLLAPLLYLLMKNLKLPSLVLIVLVYASPWSPGIPGMRGIFFFSLGAWLGIWKVNMLEICRKVKWLAAIAAVILLFIASYWNSSQYHEWLLRAFYPFGMITFMNVCDRLIDSETICERLCSLSAAVFFIYAAHEIFILGWTKGLFLRTFGDGLLGSWISYLFVPVAVLIVCYVLYLFFNRFTPKTLAFVSGGRTKK